MTVLPAATLHAIEARANAATEGPWTTDGEIQDKDEFWMHYIEVHTAEPDTWDVPVPARSPDDAHAQADAAFIAHARTDIPVLLAEVRRLQARTDELAEALREARANGGVTDA